MLLLNIIRLLQSLQKICKSKSVLSASGVTKLWVRGWKLCWRRPTGQQSEKSWEMIVNTDVDVYTKTRNHRVWKYENANKTTTYWTPKDIL